MEAGMLEREPNNRNEIKHVVEALNQLKIAVGSLHPDPMETIAQYRRSKNINTGLLVFTAFTAFVAAAASLWTLLK